MSKRRYSIYFFCICFYLVGIIAGILILLKGKGGIVAPTFGLSREEFLYVQSFSLYSTAFWGEILKWRIGLWGIIALFYGSKKKNIALLFFFFFLGMGSGVLVEQLTIFYGLRGILLFFLIEFPHFFFYTLAYLILGDPQNSGSMIILSFGVLMVGCLSECYVNPLLLYRCLKL